MMQIGHKCGDDNESTNADDNDVRPDHVHIAGVGPNNDAHIAGVAHNDDDADAHIVGVAPHNDDTDDIIANDNDDKAIADDANEPEVGNDNEADDKATDDTSDSEVDSDVAEADDDPGEGAGADNDNEAPGEPTIEQVMDTLYGPRTGPYDLCPHRLRDFEHLHAIFKETVMTQYNIKLT